MEVLSSRILLRSPEPERAIDFYGRVLGLHVYREFGAGPGARGVVFFLGGGFLEVSGRCDDRPTDASQIWLQVRDADAEHARLRDHGVQVEEPPTDKPWGLRELRARDPDGRMLVLVEVPETHPLRRDQRD